jgi:hypothetical protein
MAKGRLYHFDILLLIATATKATMASSFLSS